MENEIEKVTKQEDAKYKTEEADGQDKSVCELSSDEDGVDTIMEFLRRGAYLQLMGGRLRTAPMLPISMHQTMQPGIPFKDAYHYMDWLLTLPLVLLDILLVMELPTTELNAKAWALGLGLELMIVSGYHGELVVTADLLLRWGC